MRKSQIRWAVVGFRGFINHGYMCFSRRAVIEKVLVDYRQYGVFAKYAGLSDAQFWRIIKRKRGYSVRRVALTVRR